VRAVILGRCLHCYTALYDYRPCACREIRRIGPTFQSLWACEHHPVSMDNFFDKREACEMRCHESELKWYHSGKRPVPNQRILACSSAAERLAVNERVVGSIPTSPANLQGSR
jgi:hypothetical protein